MVFKKMKIKKNKYSMSDAFVKGKNYYYGLGTRKSYKKAYPYILQAAKIGNPHAQNILGCYFSGGHGIKINYNKSFYWFNKSVHNKDFKISQKRNYTVALCNLAMAYDFGQGIPKNKTKAIYFYKKAAELGDLQSQCNLGCVYREVNKMKEAIYWTKKAARKGDSRSQYNLGQAYFDGYGVSKSIFYAKIWFQKSAKQNHKGAINKLKLLNTTNVYY